jgi:transposase
MTYSQQDINKIRELKATNATWEQIGISVGKNKEAVRKWYARNKNNLDLPPKEKTSRSKIKGRMALILKKNILEQNRTSVRKLKGVVTRAKAPETPCQSLPSRQSIHRYMKNSGFQKVTLKNKFMISEKNKAARLAFAQKYEKVEKAFWDTVVFSDETTVRSMPSKKKVDVWVHKSVPKKDLPVNPQVKFGGISVMFWSCISVYGVGPLVPIDGNVNSKTYIEFVKENLLPYLDDVCEQDMIFMQDGASCHKSKKTMEFLREERVELLEWPAQSPYLNPIENLWTIIKRRRDEKFDVPRSKQELIAQMQQIWTEIDQGLIDKLFGSMPNRIQECIGAKGMHTSY